jgi:hypothetical protein
VRLDRQGVELAFDVTVSNPLLNALHAPRYAYSVDVSGRTLASGRAAAGGDFPAAGVGVVSIPACVSYDVLAAAYGDLDGVSDVPYVFRGSFSVPLLGSTVDVPFEYTGVVPVVRSPTIELAAVATSELSALGGRVTIDAWIRNPNAFALNIDEVGYVLDLDGERLAALRADPGGSLAAGTKHRLSLVGEVSIADAAAGLLWSAGDISRARVVATGIIATPHGSLRLGE